MAATTYHSAENLRPEKLKENKAKEVSREFVSAWRMLLVYGSSGVVSYFVISLLVSWIIN